MAKKLRGFDPEKLHLLDDQGRAIALAKLLNIPAYTGITTKKLWAKIGRELWQYVPAAPARRGRKSRSDIDETISTFARDYADKEGLPLKTALAAVVEACQKLGILSKHTRLATHFDRLKRRRPRPKRRGVKNRI